MTDFLMPSLGADMDRGTVVEWMVAVGDNVQRGDIVALVETEKGIIEVEIWESGIIGELLVAEGAEVPVGTPLATLADTEPVILTPDPVPETAMPAATVSDVPPKPSPATPPIRHLAHQMDVDLAEITGTGPNGSISRSDVRSAASPHGEDPQFHDVRNRPKASPRARAVAADLRIDLASLIGTGPGLLITEADVRAAAGLPATTPAPSDTRPGPVATEEAPDRLLEPDTRDSGKEEERRRAMRRAISAVMAKSKREIPHYYLGTAIDMSKPLRWLREVNDQRPMAERILPVVLLLKATALAIGQVPEVNGLFVDGRFEASPAAHLGVAISLRHGGLIAPALHDAEGKDLTTIMVELTDLVARARTGRLRSSEMSDPTITVTNLGDRGVEVSYGVIYAPQVALVSFGKVLDRPWAENGMLAVRPVVQATLSADHRVSDGHRGGLFLEAIDRYLQEPETL